MKPEELFECQQTLPSWVVYEAKMEESEKVGSRWESNPARCPIEAFNTTCAVHIEDCEGWWFSSCCGSVQPLRKCHQNSVGDRGVLDLTPGDCQFFQHEARCSE